MAIENTVLEFGQSMGFSDLRFNDNGVIQLRIEDMGDFYIERIDTGVLLALTEEMQRAEIKHYRHALELCHPREEHVFEVNPGLLVDNDQKEHFVYSLKVDSENFTLPTLNEAFEYLKKMHDRTKI